MYAITVKAPGGPKNLEWAEVDTPRPGPGEVLVKTLGVGVNRADLLQREGHYPPPPGASEILGLEASGIVAGLGEGVKEHQVGDRVVALLAGGGYAEYFTAPANQVIQPPVSMDIVSAGGVIEAAATVVSNFDTVGLTSDDTVLIHGGAGGVGGFAIQYAKAKGATVVATAGGKKKLQHVKELGADVAIDYNDEWWTAIKVATDDHGADVIWDIIGAAYLDHNIDALATDGRMVIIGMQKGTKGELNIAKLLAKRGNITATSLRARPPEQKAAIVRKVLGEFWPLLNRGTVKPLPETRIELSKAADAHKLLESGKVIGKIILTA